MNSRAGPSGDQGGAHFICQRNECVQARAEIIELNSKVRDLTRDNELQGKELQENSYWVDNQFALMAAVDRLTEENNNL